MKQKILNLCLRCHILKSYRFVAEVTSIFAICNYVLIVNLLLLNKNTVLLNFSFFEAQMSLVEQIKVYCDIR